MKSHFFTPSILSTVLIVFMLTPQFGFTSLINSLTHALDYTLIWKVGPAEVTLITIIPWIAFGLLRWSGNLTRKNLLSLSSGFLAGALVAFTLGFLLIEIKEADLVNGFIKDQPFTGYWAIWFAISNAVISLLYFLREKLVVHVGQKDR